MIDLVLPFNSFYFRTLKSNVLCMRYSSHLLSPSLPASLFFTIQKIGNFSQFPMPLPTPGHVSGSNKRKPHWSSAFLRHWTSFVRFQFFNCCPDYLTEFWNAISVFISLLPPLAGEALSCNLYSSDFAAAAPQSVECILVSDYVVAGWR